MPELPRHGAGSGRIGMALYPQDKEGSLFQIPYI